MFVACMFLHLKYENAPKFTEQPKNDRFRFYYLLIIIIINADINWNWIHTHVIAGIQWISKLFLIIIAKKKNREQNAKSEGGKFQTEETIYKMWKIPETTQTSNSVWSFEWSLNVCFCNVRISESCAGGKKLVRLLTHSQKSVAKNNSIMAKKYTLVKTKANKLNETEPKSERINFNCINRFFAMCVCHKYVCTFKFPKSEKRKKAIWCCNSTIPCDNSNEYPVMLLTPNIHNKTFIKWSRT